MKKNAFLSIAHRGASAYTPENTIAAFDRALQLGAYHIELDVHSTLDGHAVVIHDDTLDRTTNGNGPVSEEIIATSKHLAITQLCPNASTLTQDIVQRLHNDGFIVRAWGVPSEKVMREVVQYGADGMTINFPDRLIHYLLQMGNIPHLSEEETEVAAPSLR